MTGLLLALALLAGGQASTAVETVVEVRVHGNYATPEADILALAGDLVGQPATDLLVTEVTRRLTVSGRFSAVDVRKRYRSIVDPTQILLMIVVDERPGASVEEPIPDLWRRVTASGMWLPVLQFEDGYGFTYGGRVSFVETWGPGSRISLPLTWGGERLAAVEAERSFTGGPIARVLASAGVERRINPHWDVPDRRTALRGRLESVPATWLRARAGVRLDQVAFSGRDDRLLAVGADVALDTRVDPAFPRNAVFASIGWERLVFRREPSAQRVSADVRGYVGLAGQSVVMFRGAGRLSTGPLPPFEQALLGGAGSLRGYRAGTRAGDNIRLASAELRVPITSPLSLGRAGLKVFVDAGAAYPYGAALADQRVEHGYGGGLFFNATVLSAGIDVARSRGGDTRAHISLGVRLGQ